MKVKEIMAKDVHVVYVPGTRIEALKIFAKYDISCVPVLRRSDKKLVGILTRRNIFDKPNEEQLALLMSKNIITINEDDDVKDAVKIFLEKKFRRLPVMRGDALVGIITPMNILSVIEKVGKNEPVEKYAKSTCIPLYDETPLDVAYMIFRFSDTYAMPVVNKKSKLCGIVTERDFFSFSEIMQKNVVSMLGLGADEDRWSWSGVRDMMRLYYGIGKIELPNVLVKDVMIKKPVSIYKGMSIKACAELMRRYNFRQLPMKDSYGALIGMVYDVDIISSLVD
ncbi:MAG: CBS domain-containing protein [Candidatus Thermoplasmatota archaeon]